MIKSDQYFKDNLFKLLNYGYWDENPRAKYVDGVKAHSKFITQVFEEYDLSKNEFPITTLRNTSIKTGIKEIFWIYQKQTSDLKDARDMGVNWWDQWDIGDGSIGQRYGATVRRWNLMNKLLTNLKKDPFSRRHIINLYQESDLNETIGLYPCAYETQWSVRKVNGEMFLDMTLVQRSSDYLMANYINKSQYVALQMMVANHCEYKIGKFCHLVQNLHIYDRHIQAAEEIYNKSPLDTQPLIILSKTKDFYDFTIKDFNFINFDNITKIKSPLEIAI